ncbi:MAG: acyltransferase [Alphaproteobacteria bacterium]
MVVNGNRIKGFDGLRGLAVLLVVLNHKASLSDGMAAAGVWLFFVLSGFLIVRILVTQRAKVATGEVQAIDALCAFWRRRAARIFPLYYLVLIVFAAIALFVATPGYGIAESAFHWLYGTNFLVAERGWGFALDSQWSLAIEEQFYVLAAPLLLFVPQRHAFATCCACVVVGVGATILVAASGASATAIFLNSLTNFAMIGFGGAIGIIADRRMPRWIVSGTAQFTVLGAYVGIAVLLEMTNAGWRMLGIMVAPLAGLALVQIYKGQRTRLVAGLELAPLRPLGQISYGLYLIHPLIVFSAFGIEEHASRAIEIAVAIGLAGLSWRYFETPVARWIRGVKVEGDSRPSPSATDAGFARPARSSGAGDRRAFPACAS